MTVPSRGKIAPFLRESPSCRPIACSCWKIWLIQESKIIHPKGIKLWGSWNSSKVLPSYLWWKWTSPQLPWKRWCYSSSCSLKKRTSRKTCLPTWNQNWKALRKHIEGNLPIWRWKWAPSRRIQTKFRKHGLSKKWVQRSLRRLSRTDQQPRNVSKNWTPIKNVVGTDRNPKRWIRLALRSRIHQHRALSSVQEQPANVLQDLSLVIPAEPLIPAER